MPDLRLRLEDGPHQVREAPVERDDLLELVEDDHDAPLALGRELAEQLEQALDRVVDVRRPPACLEGEAERPVVGVDLHRRPDPQAAEEIGSALDHLPDRRVDVRVDRLRESGCESLLRRRPHQVAVADEHPARARALCVARSTSDDLP